MNAPVAPVDLARCRVLVLGLGVSGLSIVRFALSRRVPSLRVHDSRAEPPGRQTLERLAPQARRLAGPLTANAFEDIDLVVVSPGVPLDQPALVAARQAGMPILGDVELFARTLATVPHRPRVLAVTGTNGKTTVTTLAGVLARAGGFDVEVAGNIGPPVLDALLACEAAGRMPAVWVLELSSFQLELTSSLDADAAVMLNLTEDHLDRHGDMRAYGEAKARIFQGRGLQVLNRDDPASLAMRRPGRVVIDFGLDAPAGEGHFGVAPGDASANDRAVWLMAGAVPVMPLAGLHLAGRHNAANALAALALVSPLGIPLTRLAEALSQFRGLPHRVECIHEAGGVRYYDDSKGTNVGATVAALDGLGAELASTGGRIVLVAGGDGKGQRFEPLAAPAARHVRAVVLIGRDGPAIGRALAGAVEQSIADDLPEAVARAKALARPGDAVLLSPACASLDMFRDYAHRAEVFAQAVREVTRG
jgi:UDP-N-acetylmuramoylalanine--D-glutamate ligase